MDSGPAEGSGVEEREATGHVIAGTPGQVAFDQEMMQRGADLLRAQTVGGAVVEGGNAGHGWPPITNDE